jgi:hypothetical protein
VGTVIIAMMVVGGWAIWIWSLRVENKYDETVKKKVKKQAPPDPQAPQAHEWPPADHGWPRT